MRRLRELAYDVRMVFGTRNPSSKFIAYFQLLDAFKAAGCPVCTLVEQGALKTLDGLLYEQVNDPSTRQRLVESHGFCNWHAWMLPSVHNSSLGAALIYRHLLGETLEHLQTTLRATCPRSRWQRLRERLAGPRDEGLPILAWRTKRSRCYLCTFARRSEQDCLRTILEFIGEPEFAEAFARSSGLCLPHLYAAMAIGRDHPNLRALVAAHEARWKDLVWELEEFSRKFDYRYVDEVKGRESSSWHRVLEVFVGRAGLFGPERDGASAPQTEEAHGSLEAGAGRPQAIDAEQSAEVESLRFENEKLRRRVDELLAQRAEDRQTRLALEFQVLKLASDLRAVAADLAAATGGKPRPSDGTPSRIVSDGQPPIQEGEHSQRI